MVCCINCLADRLASFNGAADAPGQRNQAAAQALDMKRYFLNCMNSSLHELASDLSSTTQHAAVQLNGIVGTLRYIVNFLLFPKKHRL
jgi:hypothetical protein